MSLATELRKMKMPILSGFGNAVAQTLGNAPITCRVSHDVFKHGWMLATKKLMLNFERRLLTKVTCSPIQKMRY
jgi:hypothetical protein